MYSALTWSSFCDVEERGRRLHVLQPELRHHLGHRHDLPAVGRPPAEQGQVVAHGLGQVAPLPELLQGHVVAALGQLLALLVHDHRQVAVEGVVGGVVAQGVAQEEDLGRGREQVLAPQDVGDPHVGVVDRVGQDEHGLPTRPEDHEVLEGGVLEDDVAPDDVVDDGLPLVGGAETQGPPGPGAEAAVAAEPVVAAGGGAGGDVVLGAVAVVGGPVGDQPLGGLARRGACAATGGRGPRPSRARATSTTARCPRPGRRGSARGRCPRCGGRTCRPCGGRRAS